MYAMLAIGKTSSKEKDMSKTFIDSYGARGNPKLTYVNVRGKSLCFELGEDSYFKVTIPDGKNARKHIRITKNNARKLAYWLLDNIKE